MNLIKKFLIVLTILVSGCATDRTSQQWTITDQGYFDTQGLSILVFHDFYPVGKQGGIEIIHHGVRVASNGFIQMEEPVNGKRLSDPERAEREIDSEQNQIKAKVNYDDFDFAYSIRIWQEDEAIRLAVDLDEPLPEEWKDKITFVMEFYPPLFFGKTWKIGETSGIIPRQAMGPLVESEPGDFNAQPMGTGKNLILAAEDPERKIIIENMTGELTMLDERNYSGRGWIHVKSKVDADKTENAVEWKITPNIIPGWERDPMIAVSQVGYHPDQVKKAIIELEPGTNRDAQVKLIRVHGDQDEEVVFSNMPETWGKFLRYDYAVFDFTSTTEPGMYTIRYRDQTSHPFRIGRDIFKNGVWQPTLEAYFPIQMCHIGVRDRAAIWHGPCHLDDARQAPLAIEHTDGYRQYAEAETNYLPGSTIPFLNRGGWHDAGDDDLAAGSQASTTLYLALANELCKDQPDQTTVDLEKLHVEMRQPDGIPDFIQQIRHGAVNLLSGYRAAGHSFTGIIATREGRNITGDWASQTDQLFYDPQLATDQRTLTHSGIPDDRWVFTNHDTGLEYQVVAALAAASRSLKGFEDGLADECLRTAIKAWKFEQSNSPVSQPNAYIPGNNKLEEILATAELLITTEEELYEKHLITMMPEIKENMHRGAWGVARAADLIDDEDFQKQFRQALNDYQIKLDSMVSTNPFGVPWRPRVWGIGWDIQRFALEHFYLVEQYPDLFDREIVLRVLNYVLGVHPGSNTSLVSGVGAHSITSAFGVYRDWWNYIPGGMVSGTALIRPDFPELKEDYPYFWQQSEYVMPGAGSYIFCVLASERLLNGE